MQSRRRGRRRTDPMEEKPNSRKRRRYSASHPLGGVLTRSRSEIFLHRNRSGRSRPDRRRRNLQKWIRNSESSEGMKSESSFGDQCSLVSIKDLRMRRVFSPTSVVEECYCNEDAKIAAMAEDCGLPHIKKEEETDGNLRFQVQENEGEGGGHGLGEELLQIGSVDEENKIRAMAVLPEIEMEEENLCCVEQNYEGEVGSCGLGKERNQPLEEEKEVPKIAAESENNVKPEFLENLCCQEKENASEVEVSVSNEEWLQATPPDKDIFQKSIAEEAGANTVVGLDLPAADALVETPTNMLVSSDSLVEDVVSSSKKDANIPKKRLGLAPCSRLKLFRNPNCFSYRRLLPFLMDLAKDNSSALEIRSCPDYSPLKIGKNEEMPLLPLLGSASDDPEVGATLDASPRQSLVVGLGTPPLEKSGASQEATGSSGSPSEFMNLDSSEQLTPEIPIQNHPQNPDSLLDDSAVSPEPISFGESVSHPGQLVSDSSCKFQPADNGVTLHEIDFPNETSSGSPMCHEVSPTEENVCNIQDPSDWSGKAERDCKMLICTSSSDISTHVNPLDTLSSHRNLSQLEVPALLEKPVAAPRKGILKTPVGRCRGLCLCLNCASYRINAEKAYEFSRKQLQEAEELVLGLRQELSCFRNLMKQVEGVCRRASEAEELAMNRLQKMNHDLDIQSRIMSLQRPRVRFADYVEEKLIPRLGAEDN